MQSAGFTKKEREAVEKDLHLVLAAREKLSDGAVVLSSDDTARALFARIGDLAELGWARQDDTGVAQWLAEGANASAVRLGDD
jgi:hypothetical protein